MTKTLNISVERKAFLDLLNVLCDSLLEDQCRLKIFKNTLSSNGLEDDYPVRADLSFLTDLLPRMEAENPGIFMYHSPILEFMKAFE